MKRFTIVLTGTLLMLLLTINAIGSSINPSPATGIAPLLTVTPSEITVLVPVNTSTIITRPLFIDNVTAGTTLSWTIAVSSSAEIQLSVAPDRGTNAATVNVQIAVNPISATGLYTAYVVISLEPDTTLGAGITLIPVQVLAAESLHQNYLPLVAQNFIVISKPIAPPLGLAFVGSAELPATETRYQRAQGSGGQINRRPMYWPNIELAPIDQPRVFDWTKQDASIVADIQHGLEVLPILMLTPIGLDTGGSRSVPAPRVGDGLRSWMTSQQVNQPSSVTSPPQGLYLSIFSDGTDVPGPNKPINPNNRWAYFVNAAVNRYKPGGALAQALGWGNSKGVYYWEIWNEEDLDQFFSGSPTDYARILKVAYLAATQADPQAVIVMGGLAHSQKPQWLGDVLTVIATDPLSNTYHGFMDAVASHTYVWAWQAFSALYQDRSQLDAHGLTHVKLWITETGVPVCGDSTFPACNDPQNRWFRAAPDEQAAYLIQNLTYALWLKAQTYIWFQLYDDCGNVCGLDAYGLVRNDNTTRTAYQTYQFAVNQLTHLQPYWRDRRTITATNWISGNQEIIAFKRPISSERVVMMWTRYYTNDVVLLAATAPSATLFLLNGTGEIIYPISGTYAISLPLATNRNFKGSIGGSLPDGTAAIGGSPRILVEYDPAVK